MIATPRLVVTGAQGFVAGSILRQGRTRCEIHAVSRSPRPPDWPDLHWYDFDPFAAEPWDRLFREARPDAVIHTAAVADIDLCERHPEEAWRTNVDLTRALADRCARQDVRFVLCSTDTVFDGEHAPYQESDVPVPVNVYARTKIEAEHSVVQSGARAAIARLSLVVGGAAFGSGNSFLVRLLESWKKGNPVSVPASEIRTPIDVVTLGQALLELATRDLVGTFHLAGNTRVSRFELTREIAGCFGFPLDLVTPQTAAPVGRAPRPRDVSLTNAKVRSRLRTPMLDLPEALSLVRQNCPHSA